MSAAPYFCWQCGTELREMILPVSRREECPGCRAEIHACRMCVHYHPRVADQCREDRAEQVSDKTRANFCDYYAPNEKAYQGSDQDASAQARDQLEALFGGGGGETTKSDVPSDLEDLFKKD